MVQEKPKRDLSALSREELAEELRALTEQTETVVRSTEFLRFKPLKYQLPWFESDCEIRPVVAPNQQGKTTWGAIETIAACIGDKPIALGGNDRARPLRSSRKGYRALVAGESFDALRDNVLPKFDQFISPGMLQGAPKKNAEGFPYLWRFASGAEMVLMSYQQNVDVFEGAVWDRAWFDEPPPQNIFNAVRRGLMARRGRTDLSLTPLKEAWLLDELLVPARDPDSPLYGSVAVFPEIDIHFNCSTCNPGVGVLPHDRILTFLALVPPAERAAREFGTFAAVADLEFPYVAPETHVVPDIDVKRWGWPVVEVVDPAMKRPLHIGWFTVDPDENWFWVHAAQVPNDGFRRMVRDIQNQRRFVGREPDRAIMDRRGGKHRIDVELRQDWFDKFREAGIRYEESVDTHVQTLHDWMRPTFNPHTGDKQIPKLRICQSVADMQKGPLWAFRRFVWVTDPTKRDRRVYDQTGKDWIDLAMYLRAAEPSFKKLMRMADDDVGRERSQSNLAMSYSPESEGAPRAARTRTRGSLAESYSTSSDWRHLIPRGYS